MCLQSENTLIKEQYSSGNTFAGTGRDIAPQKAAVKLIKKLLQ